MGVVYEAHDLLRDERVALKTIRHLRPKTMRQFKREFRALADISHPNLASLYELVAGEDGWFFTMELLDGSDITTHFSSIDRWDADGAEGMLRHSFQQLAEAVAELHRSGHLHRDIKPSNVMVTREGRTVLLDFGVMGAVGESAATAQRDFVGTPIYMSPEQLLSEPLAFASDWYSVGVLLYELLAGVAPFRGTIPQLMRAKLLDVPTRPSDLRAGVPEALEKLCLTLLDSDPESRPNAAEVLACFGGRARQTTSILAPMRTELIGREEQLGDLADALASVEAGQGVVTLVHGASGMGKTALIDAFLSETTSNPRVLTLRGRCHERELIRYRAVDALVDALGEHLAGLSAPALASLMPPDAQLLSVAFPALGRLSVSSPAGAELVTDPRLLRERATHALRALLSNLALDRTLVLYIDDVQWGDQESAELIAALMSAPDVPPLLLVLTYRSSHVDRSPFLRTLLEWDAACPLPERCRRIEVKGLSDDEGAALAAAVLQRRQLASGEASETIATESGGSPLFIHAMVRFAEHSGTTIETGLSLETVLAARARLLSAPARRVLDTLAVAGAPSPHSLIRAATGLGPRSYDDALQTLRAAQMIRSTGTDEHARVEVYHDRIGEMLLTQLAPALLRQTHAELAEVLVRTDDTDPELCFLHLRGAGDDTRAGRYALRAAEHAAAALSFTRAATLYRIALKLGSSHDHDPSALSERLGEMLVASGRGAEAAQAFLEAAEGREGNENLELKRRAGEQLLRSGRLVRGRQTLDAVMGEIGLRLPSNTVTGVASLLYWRARLRLRGLRFRPTPPAERDPRATLRVDTLHSVATGLSVSEPATAGSLGAQTVIEAFHLGDPERLARALLLELVFVSTEGWRSRDKVRKLLSATRPIADSTGSPSVQAFLQAIEGVIAFQQGRFVEAFERCEEAREMMLTRCPGMAWEVGSTALYAVSSMTFIGKLEGLAAAPAHAAEALARGDIFTSASIRAAAVPALLIARGDPAASRAESEAALRLWGRPDVFQNIHFMATMSQVQADFYEGEGARALARMQSNERGIRRSLLLSVQVIRTYWTFARANARLAAAVGGAGRRRALVRAAAKDGATLRREGAPWCIGLGDLVLAQVAVARGDRPGAAAHARRSADALADADLNLYASAARFLHGWALGGEEGGAICKSTLDDARRGGVHDPRRIILMFAPALTLHACP